MVHGKCTNSRYFTVQRNTKNREPSHPHYPKSGGEEEEAQLATIANQFNLEGIVERQVIR